MSCFHFHVTQVKRSCGHSVTEMAAYRSCDKLHSDYYHETYNYSKKPGLIISEILAPEYLPPELFNRESLWDSVEYSEKRNDAQLAFNFDFTLQKEFSNEENIEIVRQFIQDNFVERGMICDWAFHYPTENDKDENKNPHVHMLCPMRPLNKDGTWGVKQKSVPLLDESGNPVLDETGKQKKTSVKTTDWSEPNTLIEWRKNWAEINNKMFIKKGLTNRISADTLEAQGIDLLPTIHEGPNIRAMEAQGIKTQIGEYNRWVKKMNSLIVEVHSFLLNLATWVKNFKQTLPKEKSISELLADYTKGRDYGAYSNKARSYNNQFYLDAISYTFQNNIITISDLNEKIAEVENTFNNTKVKQQAIKSQIDKLNKEGKMLTRLEKVKPIGEEYEKKKFKITRDKYYSEHKKEIDTYFWYKKNEKQMFNNSNKDRIVKQLKPLLSKQNEIEAELKGVSNELKKLQKLQYCIDVATGKKDGTLPIKIDGKTVYIDTKDVSVLRKLEIENERIKNNENSLGSRTKEIDWR